MKAVLRSFKPKEQKYSGHDNKFKRTLLMKNIARLRAFTPNVNIPLYMEYFLSWESPVLSASVFLVCFCVQCQFCHISVMIHCLLQTSLLIIYYFQLFMVPLGLTILLLKNYFQQLIGHGMNPVSIPVIKTVKGSRRQIFYFIK